MCIWNRLLYQSLSETYPPPPTIKINHVGGISMQAVVFVKKHDVKRGQVVTVRAKGLTVTC
jgi:hypothetical protein